MADPLTHARVRFAELCELTDLPLDEACAWIAAEENPEVEAEDLIAKLDVLAEGLWVPAGSPLPEQVARLSHHLHQELGFDGDRVDYGSPRNSLLDSVLDRRRGLPILLCIVVMEVGRRAGVVLEGVGFPGHFLVAPVGAEPRFFLDPFNGGRILTRDRLVQRLQDMAAQGGGRMANPDPYLRGVPPRYIVLRVCNNLKGAWLRAGEIEGALRAVDRLLLLDPGLHEERRDRGMMLHHLGRRAEAADGLRDYLEHCPEAPDRERIEVLLRELE